MMIIGTTREELIEMQLQLRRERRMRPARRRMQPARRRLGMVPGVRGRGIGVLVLVEGLVRKQMRRRRHTGASH